MSDSLPAQLRVHEIYDAIQGESTLIGMPCTLIRLAGCPLRCSYCDTPEAIPMDSGTMMPVDEIVARVHRTHRPLILVTGGEPLAQKACIGLLEALRGTGAIIQLETSGALDIRHVPVHVRKILDIKTPGSGEASRNRWSNLASLRQGDEIKFVLTGRSDYEWSLACIRDHKLDALNIPILFSPCWGDLDPQQLSSWMLEDNPPARLLLQQHKSIWGTEAASV